jgi:hypothetical protein
MKATDLRSQFRHFLSAGWPLSTIAQFLGLPTLTLEQWFFEDLYLEPIDDPVLKSLARVIQDLADELHRRGMVEINGRWIPILLPCELPDHFRN